MTKKITKTEHIIIFDIDSSSIGGGLFRFAYNANGDVVETAELYSLRKKITKGNEYSFEKFFNQTLKTFNDVADAVHLQSLITIDAIYCNVGIPWMSAQKRTTEYRKKNKFILTQELIDELTEKERTTSFKKNSNYTHHDVELIDRHVLSVYGNGYRLRRPIGTEMSDAKIHTLTSVMSIATKKAFSRIIEKIFHREVMYLSNTFISYKTLRTQSPDINDAIILDISSEVTEIVVMRDDGMQHLGSIPVGVHGIVRHLRDEMNISYEKAYTLVQLHHKESLDTEYTEKIAKLLRSAFLVWFKAFFNICDEYSKNGSLPSMLIMRSDKNISTWLEFMILQEETLQEHMHTTNPVTLRHMESIIPAVNESSDSELAIIATHVAQKSSK